MAATFPPDQPPGQADVLPKTFAAVLTGKTVATPQPLLGRRASYRGEPAFFLSSQELDSLSSPFKNALIGRFAYRRPPLDEIRRFFVSLGLQGDCPIGLLDSKHVLIRPSCEDDYTRLFWHRTYFIKNVPMHISKWTLNFKADCEASIAPVWVSFPELPLPLLNQLYVQEIATLLGRPLKVDAATIDLRRPSVARVLVEIDVAKTMRKRLWIGDENNVGFWQQVTYENWPSFCDFCSKLGHSSDECFHKQPDLKPAAQSKAKLQQRQGDILQPSSQLQQVYMPKPKVVGHASEKGKVANVQSAQHHPESGAGSKELQRQATPQENKSAAKPNIPVIATSMQNILSETPNSAVALDMLQMVGLERTPSAKGGFQTPFIEKVLGPNNSQSIHPHARPSQLENFGFVASHSSPGLRLDDSHIAVGDNQQPMIALDAQQMLSLDRQSFYSAGLHRSFVELDLGLGNFEIAEHETLLLTLGHDGDIHDPRYGRHDMGSNSFTPIAADVGVVLNRQEGTLTDPDSDDDLQLEPRIDNQFEEHGDKSVPGSISIKRIFSTLKNNLGVNEHHEKDKTPMLEVSSVGVPTDNDHSVEITNIEITLHGGSQINGNLPNVAAQNNNQLEETNSLDHSLASKRQGHLSPAQVVFQRNMRRLHRSQGKELRDIFVGPASETELESEDGEEHYWALEDKLATPPPGKQSKEKKRRGRPKKKK